MIQRIQTIFLFVALVLTGSLFCLPYSNLINSKLDTYVLTSMTLKASNGTILFTNYLIPILLIISIICLVYAIVMFKNRKLQMKVCLVNIALQSFIALMLFSVIKKAQALVQAPQANYFVIALPLISIILCFLAYKAIKKDDDLIRSVDRLR